VYDKKPVTVEEAVNKNHKKQKRIAIELNNGDKLVLDSIYYKDNELHGLLTRPKKKEKILITETKYNFNNRPYKYTYNVTVKTKIEVKIEVDEIVKIRLHNKAKSITLNVFIPFMALGAFIIVGFASNLATCGDWICLSL
jgi:hypothetical protein